MPCHTCSNSHSLNLSLSLSLSLILVAIVILLITTGQEKLGGAEYIDPEMRKSTDFTSWLEKEETAKRLQGKKVSSPFSVC
jgi:hypothetical protein